MITGLISKHVQDSPLWAGKQTICKVSSVIFISVDWYVLQHCNGNIIFTSCKTWPVGVSDFDYDSHSAKPDSNIFSSATIDNMCSQSCYTLSMI